MASAWGSSWGTSWGTSWRASISGGGGGGGVTRWRRRRGGVKVENLRFGIFDSSARLTTGSPYISARQINYGWSGVRLSLNVTAVSGSTPTLDVKVRGYTATGQVADIPTAFFAQKSATGSDILSIYPGVDTINNVVDILPYEWDVYVAVAGSGGSFTMELKGEYIV